MPARKVESGGRHSFGSALRHIGDERRSRYNPHGMRQNCVSVALSRLLGHRTVHHFWASLGQDWRGYIDNPLSYPEISELLKRTGRDYRWRRYERRQSTNDGPSMIQAIKADYTRPERFQTYDERVIIFYTRPGDIGHVVNGRITVTWEEKFLVVKDNQTGEEYGDNRSARELSQASDVLVVRCPTPGRPDRGRTYETKYH